MPLLIPSQRLDGIELGGFSGRKIAKYDARQKGTREGNDSGISHLTVLQRTVGFQT